MPGGLANSTRGQTSICAKPVKGDTVLNNICKWPKKRYFIDVDMQPYFVLRKAKNGDREIVLCTATLTSDQYNTVCFSGGRLPGSSVFF